MGKPLFNQYNIYHTDSNIPNKLKSHIFKENMYFLANRCVTSYSNSAYSGVYVVRLNNIDIYEMFHGFFSFNEIVEGVYIRPVVYLQPGIQLTRSVKAGYQWDVN